MQSVEDVMEKGMAGRVEGSVSSCPTSSTLVSSGTENTSPSKEQSTHGPLPLSKWKPDLGSSWLRSFFSREKKYRTPTTTRRLNDHVKGYPNVAAFLDSDEGFTIYRRYGYLQARLLLHKQEELRRLEKDLERMDKMIARDNEDALCSYDVRGPDAQDYGKLLGKIESAYCSYSNTLTAAQQMMAFGKPAEAERESVGRYLFNRKSLIKAEGSWVAHREDLVTLRAGREHAWLDSVVEGILKICHCRLVDLVFRSKETKKKAQIDSENMPARPPPDEDKYEIFYTPSRVARLTNSILTFIILVLLALPIYILYHLVHDVGSSEAYMTCVGILVVFTLAFSSVLSLFTKARRHEILAATAAYCAVLVVFLGNVGSPTGDVRNPGQRGPTPS